MRELFIKVFQVEDDYYIYDVNSNSFFQATATLVRLLEDGQEQDKSKGKIDLNTAPSKNEISDARMQIAEMQKKGFFLENRPEITFLHHRSKKEFLDDIKCTLNKKLGRITLVVTEDCNLRCRYCAYSGNYFYHRSHSSKIMSEDVMRKAIDFYLSHSQENEEKNISFYGGEPLLNFEIVKNCVNYVTSVHSAPVNFNMTINGTLLTKAIMRFIVEKKISVLISIDGPKEVHDRNRIYKNGVGSFNRVYQNLMLFKEMFPRYYCEKVRFNMIISPPFQPKAINDFISDPLIKPASVSFSRVNTQFTNWYNQFTDEELAAYRKEKNELLNSFLSKLEKKRELCEIEKHLFSKRYVFIHLRNMELLPSKYPSHGQCIIGSRALLVNTDGSFNFCTQVDDVYNLGDVFNGFNYDKIEQIYMELEELFKKNCYDCWAIRFCMKCVKNLNRNGKICKDLLKAHCSFTKRSVLNEMKEYIRIRRTNPNAFHHLDDVMLE